MTLEVKEGHMFILYDFIYVIIALFYLPFILMKGKWHSGFKMRFGIIPRTIYETLNDTDTIWFHAVSVGEVLAVMGLIKKIKISFPQYQIVVSTVTQTGYKLAQSQLAKNDVVIYAPLDISFIVRWYIKVIDPKIYISAETEIWPNLFTALADQKIPIVQVNGRLSEKSFKNYQRIKFLLKNVLNDVTAFCMQTPADAERIIPLGVDPQKVLVIGNMKFDDLEHSMGSVKVLSYKPQDLVWIAGSTHPGEEKIVLEVFKSLQKEFPALHLVIAPRHVGRTSEIVNLIQSEGLNPVKFSEIKSGMESDSIVVVDTIGHLRELYRLATVVFVGKSLIGQGGQNIIEPAFFAKPIVVGPHMQNFKNILNLFQEAQAIVQIKDPQELVVEMRRLLQDPQYRKKLGESAKSVVVKNQGATEKTFQIISDLLS